MAKPILPNWVEESVSFAPTKVDRSKIYASRKRIAVDASGAACSGTRQVHADLVIFTR